MSEIEMKELNKRMIQKLPENRAKSSIQEYEMRRREDLCKRKQVMEQYSRQLKNNVLCKAKNEAQFNL